MTTADLLARVKQHTAQFEHLRTFQQVHVWDAAAAALVGELEAAATRLRSEASQHVARADQVRDERARASFFKRLFTSREPERQLRSVAFELGESAHQLYLLMNVELAWR